MATSGTYKSEKVGGTWPDAYYLEFEWNRTSYDSKEGTSTISWTAKLVYDSLGQSFVKSEAGSLSVIVNGNSYSKTFANGEDNIFTGTATITHEIWIEKTFSFFCKFSKYDKGLGGTGTLDAIPIRAALTYTAAFNDESNPRIEYSNPSGSQVAELAACIASANDEFLVPYRAIDKNDYQYTFNLTNDERKALRQYVETGNKATVRFYLRTTIGNEVFYDYQIRTLTLVNHEPTLSPTVIDLNARTKELTGKDNVFISGFSQVQLTSGAAARKEATIASQVIKCGDFVSHISPVVMETFKDGPVNFTITDSRGNTTTQSVSLNVVRYVKLTNNLQINSLTASGELTFTIKGQYFNGSFGAKNNSMEVEYSLRDSQGNYVFNSEGSGWVMLGTITPTVSGNSYSYTHKITGLNYLENYELTVNVIDELTPVQSSTKAVAATPVFDWSKEDFHHNTKVVMEKDKTITGKKADGTEVIALTPLRNSSYNSNGETRLGEADIYSGSAPDVAIGGDNVRIWNYNGLYINGNKYGENRVIWEGASHMNANQTVSLNEFASAFPNGIVLVFSYYDTATSTAKDHSWSCHFVPKELINLHSNEPHTFFMGINAGFSSIGAKYIYIQGLILRGHAGNTSSGNNSGITFNNSNYVLRYVIGV